MTGSSDWFMDIMENVSMKRIKNKKLFSLSLSHVPQFTFLTFSTCKGLKTTDYWEHLPRSNSKDNLENVWCFKGKDGKAIIWVEYC